MVYPATSANRCFPDCFTKGYCCCQLPEIEGASGDGDGYGRGDGLQWPPEAICGRGQDEDGDGGNAETGT